MTDRANPPPDDRAPAAPEVISETNRRVWDMVLHLVHPTALYVLFQLLLVDHLGKSRALPLDVPLALPALALYVLQFLGAWTVFYTTLLRDMGYRCAWGTILLLAALAGALLQYVIIPTPKEAPSSLVLAWIGVQLGLAVVAWPITFLRWLRLKRASETPKREEAPAAKGERRPSSVLTVAAIANRQQFLPGEEGHQAATEWFYTWGIWILVLVPLLAAILLAAIKRKRTPELPHVDDLTWDLEVSMSELPVLIHAYQPWSIGDRVVENQVAKLASETQGRLRVFWLDIDKCPAIVQRHPTLEEKSVALFVSGKLVWQAVGVHDHLTMQREIAPFLAAASSTK